MDNAVHESNFVKLSKRVDKLLEILQILSEDNAKLKTELEMYQRGDAVTLSSARIWELEKEIKRLKKENKTLKEREKLIKNKVERLAVKLDEIEL